MKKQLLLLAFITGFAVAAFAQTDSVKAYKALEGKVQRLLAKVIGPADTACQMRFVIIRYNLNKNDATLDSVSLNSNLDAVQEAALRQGLNNLDANWQSFITAEELRSKPVLQIVFIKDLSDECGIAILNEKDGLRFREGLDEFTGKPPVIGAAKWRGLPVIQVTVSKTIN